MASPLRAQIKRIYAPTDGQDGFRILVDRLWPRGMHKQTAAIDLWAKHLAPSCELRIWFGHAPAKFDTFRKAYLDELLVNSSVEEFLTTLSGHSVVTLLYAARDPSINHAVVLRGFLELRLGRNFLDH